MGSAGDVNADGFDDVIIGAPDADPNGDRNAGESYVVYGSSTGFNGSLDLDQLDGSNGFVIKGTNRFVHNSINRYRYGRYGFWSNRSGFLASGIGDINADGFDDLVVGAPFAGPQDNLRSGESYIVYGESSELI